MTRARARAILLLGTLSVAPGCLERVSGPGESDMPANLDTDIALVAADAALEDLGVMLVPGAVGLDLPWIVPPSLAREIAVTFRDAAGDVQDDYDNRTTATVRVQLRVEGATSRGPWSARVERTRDLTASGLEGDEILRTWNGSGTETVEGGRHTDDGPNRTYEMNGETVVQDVVVPVPGSGAEWPISGTVTRRLRVTWTNGPDGDVTVERTAALQFNGTRWAGLTVGGKAFQLDLGARTSGSPFRDPPG